MVDSAQTMYFLNYLKSAILKTHIHMYIFMRSVYLNALIIMIIISYLVTNKL